MKLTFGVMFNVLRDIFSEYKSCTLLHKAKVFCKYVKEDVNAA